MDPVKVKHPRTDKLVVVKPWFPTKVTRSWDDYTKPERKPYGHQYSTKYEDAEIQSLDRGGYMLRVAIDKDDESGEIFDVDGDRAMERIIMHYGKVLYFDSHSLAIDGLVNKEDEDDEDEYHEGWRKPWQPYRKERWTMYQRREDD